MTNTAQALYEFWSGFGIPAYTTGTIPEEVVTPYLTYSLVETEPYEPMQHIAQLWFRATDNAALLAMVDEIKAVIGTGIRLYCEGGSVTLRPDSPYVQLMTDENPEIRRAYINMQINCYHL